MPFIQVQNNRLNFRMRRSDRAKRLQMLVREQQFEIVAPKKVKNSDILAFVKQYQKWMLKQLKCQRTENFSKNNYWPLHFLAGETLFFRAKEVMLNLKFGHNAQICFDEQKLTLTVPWHQLQWDQLAPYVKQQVIKWYQQQARRAIEDALAHFCPLLGKWPAGYQIKMQKTRWGSCGIAKKIHINWLLILAPCGVLEYVVVHELCHLFHPNHGKRFWAKVAANLPEYKKHQIWLRQNGHLLQLQKTTV